LKIQILGTGCAKCKKLTDNVKKAVNDLGVDVLVEKVEDINQILDYGVMMTPGLVIDGDVKIAGKIPDVNQIKQWITESTAL
jgi:small redox-active disulfide protein 2